MSGRTLQAVRSLLAFALVALVPDVALACPVCGPAGTEDTALAYLGMTLVLSGLPLAMIGGVGYWIYRQHAAADDADRGADRPEPSA